MQIKISARHGHLHEATQEFIRERANRLTHYFQRIMMIEVVVDLKEDEKIVYIKSGVQVSYGEVVNVINAVREKGIDRIGLVADKKKGEGQAPAAPAT